MVGPSAPGDDLFDSLEDFVAQQSWGELSSDEGGEGSDENDTAAVARHEAYTDDQQQVLAVLDADFPYSNEMRVEVFNTVFDSRRKQHALENYISKCAKDTRICAQALQGVDQLTAAGR